jgi:ribonuclease-3
LAKQNHEKPVFAERLKVVESLFTNVNTAISPSFFELALTHPSFDGRPGHNYEQLEFLGDAVLNFVAGEFLFEKFPTKKEGELSRWRSWLVSRQRLNEIGSKLQLENLVVHKLDDKKSGNAKNIPGDVFEALLGAIFKTNGLDIAKSIIYDFVCNEAELEQKVFRQMDPKSFIHEWSQRQRKRLSFRHLQEAVVNAQLYEVHLFVDDRLICVGTGLNKKEAELEACRNAISTIGLDK